jgi:molybdenum cofactor cytidylyltransferase
MQNPIQDPMQNLAQQLSKTGVTAIVLAAGMARRMGGLKQTLDLGGQPSILHVVRRLIDSTMVEHILVITGHLANQVQAALQSQPVQTIYNKDYEAGEMLSSLQTGLNALPESTQWIVIAFADQPSVTPATIRHLLQLAKSSDAPIILPLYGGKRGHPVVISRTLVPEILALPHHETLKLVVHRHMSETLQVLVDDPTVLDDLDTPEDYQRLRQNWNKAITPGV